MPPTLPLLPPVWRGAAKTRTKMAPSGAVARGRPSPPATPPASAAPRCSLTPPPRVSPSPPRNAHARPPPPLPMMAPAPARMAPSGLLAPTKARLLPPPRPGAHTRFPQRLRRQWDPSDAASRLRLSQTKAGKRPAPVPKAMPRALPKAKGSPGECAPGNRVGPLRIFGGTSAPTPPCGAAAQRPRPRRGGGNLGVRRRGPSSAGGSFARQTDPTGRKNSTPVPFVSSLQPARWHSRANPPVQRTQDVAPRAARRATAWPNRRWCGARRGRPRSGARPRPEPRQPAPDARSAKRSAAIARHASRPGPGPGALRERRGARHAALRRWREGSGARRPSAERPRAAASGPSAATGGAQRWPRSSGRGPERGEKQ
mmetsp:Transcript_154290/g.494811  ORF Transcript_154290/g.494811 Transcript_154290/m.494811 type:complete len:371 (-) Transcript_154290:1477-2589(-)